VFSFSTVLKISQKYFNTISLGHKIIGKPISPSRLLTLPQPEVTGLAESIGRQPVYAGKKQKTPGFSPGVL
jgi:hypothetical protein